MKRSICSVCERKYWAQVRPYGAMITPPSGDKGMGYFQTEPKTDKCKKHAPPTKTHPKKAVWRQAGRVRHVSRRTRMGFEPKKQKEIEKDDSTIR